MNIFNIAISITCRTICLLSIVVFINLPLQAQIPVPDSITTSQNALLFNPGDSLFTIRNIHIVGNKVTKNKVILRELPFYLGESFSVGKLVEGFAEGRRLLLNTRLFIEATIAVEKYDGNLVDIVIEVQERWYIFPIPYLNPADRNINQWLFENGASLKRTDYGLKLTHYNTTGTADKLRLIFITGYSRQIMLSYQLPYFDKKLRWGISTQFALGKNREVNYNTIQNKQMFVKTGDTYIHKFFNAKVEFSFRKALFAKHYFGIAYSQEEVGDTVTQLNPNYFANGSKRIKVPELYYRLTYYNLDYTPYPTKGYATEIELNKKGFSKTVNLWTLNAIASGSWHTGKKSFFNLTGYFSIKLPMKQPYYYQRFLGYNKTFLQGYEYYVMDGTAGGFLKASLSRQLFKFSVKTPGKNRQIPERVPFTFYGKIYGNAGYVHNKYAGTNSLTNKMLYSTGIGIDIFTSYDFAIKLEWSFNALGQNGLFLHRKSLF